MVFLSVVNANRILPMLMKKEKITWRIQHWTNLWMTVFLNASSATITQQRFALAVTLWSIRLQVLVEIQLSLCPLVFTLPFVFSASSASILSASFALSILILRVHCPPPCISLMVFLRSHPKSRYQHLVIWIIPRILNLTIKEITPTIGENMITYWYTFPPLRK